MTRNTACGQIEGNERKDCYEYLGIRYATASRFSYPKEVESWEGIYDATRFGNAIPQTRTYYEHLEVPERLFYHREFREGIAYHYDEDGLNLNIYTPKEKGSYPVLVFIHGGGFNSGANYDTAIDGEAYCKRGVVFVSINYRMGVLGYFTHEELKKRDGFEGNYGLADQVCALTWIKKNIADYDGDPTRITLMGQSAGAISIQYLVLSKKCEGLFQRAVMLSGGGLFPKFALPRKAEDTRGYWKELMEIAHCSTLEEMIQLDTESLFTAVEEIKKRRKDNVYHTMPVIDGNYITDRVDVLIRNPLKLDYLIGYTNQDMYPIIMSHIGHKFANQNHGYVYYFNVDAKGDLNHAFHSSDLRYVFGTLNKSWRPYDETDEKVSKAMIDYLASFVKTGDPNQEGLPLWKKKRNHAMIFSSKKIGMGYPSRLKLIHHTIHGGDPK